MKGRYSRQNPSPQRDLRVIPMIMQLIPLDLGRAARGPIALAMGLLLTGCDAGTNEELQPLRLATTTSTVESGLFDALRPAFEERSEISLEVSATGTGAALQLAREGQADIVLVNARSAEDEFLEEGFGINRRIVMYNDFLLVGPPDGALRDEHGGSDVLEFMSRVGELQAPFLSRDDNSGTQSRELDLWSLLGIQPDGDWYALADAGMLETLQRASREKRYTLVDRATFMSNRDSLELVIIVEGDRRLFNPYGIIAVNPTTNPQTRYRQSMAFIDFVTGPEGQSIIAHFGSDRFKVPLFNPIVISIEQLQDDAQE